MVICGAGQNLAITKWARSTDLELEGLKANSTDDGKFTVFGPVLGLRNFSKHKKMKIPTYIPIPCQPKDGNTSF